MELCKVLWFEITFLDKRYGQSIAHHHLCCGAAGGSKVQGVCLMADADVQMAVGILGEQRILIAAHGDDGYLHLQHHRNEA